MAAPIIPDPDDPGHYEWDSEPEPVKQTRWRRLLGWLGKLLLAALVRAARRGVVVQLLIDDLYGGENRFLEAVAAEPGIEVRLFNPFWLRGWRPLTLLLEGVLSFRRINHRMHNKLLVVDGLLTSVGSTNFDVRSFRLNDEASLNVYDAAFAARMTEVFEADLKPTVRYTHDMWQQRPLKEKLFEKFVLPLKSQL